MSQPDDEQEVFSVSFERPPSAERLRREAARAPAPDTTAASAPDAAPAVSRADLHAILRAMVERAKGGDVEAARFVFEQAERSTPS